MNREHYLDGLRAHLADEIRHAFMKCQSKRLGRDGKTVDFEKLNERLTGMMRSAHKEGLPEEDFKDLVRSELPSVSAEMENWAPRVLGYKKAA